VFQCTIGAVEAARAGFRPLLSFPDLCTPYISSELFPLFANHVPRFSRPDYATSCSGSTLGQLAAGDPCCWSPSLKTRMTRWLSASAATPGLTLASSRDILRQTSTSFVKRASSCRRWFEL